MEHGDCQDCIFAVLSISDNFEDVAVLKCRRYPPTVFVIDDDRLGQSFPDAIDRCGEFKRVKD